MALMGDKMPKMDVEEMIALVGIEDGYVDYEVSAPLTSIGPRQLGSHNSWHSSPEVIRHGTAV
jgi:hypothetical protein